MMNQGFKFDGWCPQIVPSELGGAAINYHLGVVYKVNCTGIFDLLDWKDSASANYSLQVLYLDKLLISSRNITNM